MRVDVGADDEGDDVEEGHPHVLGQELLREGERDGRRDPADAHDGDEAGAHGGADLVPAARARDDGHGGEVDGVLDGRDLWVRREVRCAMGGIGRWGPMYNQVADKNLQDLRPQTRSTRKQPLQDPDQEMAQWRADERAVQGHFGDARVDVVSMLAAITRNPRREDFLQRCEGARRQHPRPERVLLELVDVGL